MREKNVIKYYVLCNKLKDVIRSGWLDWNIERKRVESVAEHIFSTQMLAIAMHSEYGYSIDLQKVILMLAVHELEEIIIGDITVVSKDHDNKLEKGHMAVKEVLSCLGAKDKIESLILEFDERKTPEALFAYQCDKLDCDLQAKLYDEEGCIDIEKQDGNAELCTEIAQEVLKNGAKGFSDIWIANDKKYYTDSNFIELYNFIKDNSLND